MLLLGYFVFVVNESYHNGTVILGERVCYTWNLHSEQGTIGRVITQPRTCLITLQVSGSCPFLAELYAPVTKLDSPLVK